LPVKLLLILKVCGIATNNIAVPLEINYTSLEMSAIIKLSQPLQLGATLQNLESLFSLHFFSSLKIASFKIFI